MQPDDITPSDLGSGYTLSFQSKPGTDQVRAVVKNAAGDIVVRGGVVPKDCAFQSKLDCLSSAESCLWMKGAVDNGNDLEDEEEEDEEEEEEEEDDPEDDPEDDGDTHYDQAREDY